MNYWRKNSVRQESCKKEGKNKTAKINLWLVWAGVIIFMLAGFWVAERNFIPKYYPRFYLTRSVLQTRGRLLDLWGRDQGKAGDASESVLKLKAEDARWNGHSVLVLPGGLGVSWRQMKNDENTFAQGNLDVYFLGTVREGLDYWADEERLLLRLPGTGEISVKTSQAALKEAIGFSIIPEKENSPKEKLEVLKKDGINMMNQSEIQFVGRDEEGVRLKARIPAFLFEQYLDEVGMLLEDVPLSRVSKWGNLLKERKTKGEVQEILFTIDRKLNISSITVEDLAEASLLLEINKSVSIKGRIGMEGREAGLEAMVYSGGGPKGRRALQIPELTLSYEEEQVCLELKLSGGYEGGKTGGEELEYQKLSSADGDWNDESLQKEKEKFLKKVGQLGLDFKQ